MERIIQQISENFIKTIVKKAVSPKINDIDALTSELDVDCRQTAIKIVEVILDEVNRTIRKDKKGRKDQRLVIKEKIVQGSFIPN